MNNTPAFPTNQYANGVSPSGFDKGMTLLDYFAAKAMQGFIADGAAPDVSKKIISIMAYAMADAMLKKREVSMIEEDDDIQDYKKPWVGLTLEEQTKLFEVDWDEHDGWGSLYEAIEAKLKEKNT